MSLIVEKLTAKFPGWREEVKGLQKEHGEKVISQVTVAQAYGGMRGVKSLVCDTSEVPPDKGLIIRSIPVKELTEKLPEEVLWLLLTGELPSAAELKDLQKELTARNKVPAYVWDVLKAMPKDSHPMTMFNTAILVLQRESVFRKKYDEGMKKDVYWEATLEDTLNIAAVLPADLRKDETNNQERGLVREAVCRMVRVSTRFNVNCKRSPQRCALPVITRLAP